MFDIFALGALPYVAVFVLFAGSILRYRTNRYSYSALSSQFLEDRQLLWGTVAWHIGIIFILLGHLLALAMPGLWLAVVANPAALIVVETAGVCFAILSIAGVVALAVRRSTSGRLQLVSTPVDYAVLALLLLQIVLGLWVALGYRWGAVWAPATLSPYLASLLTLKPDLAYVVDMPGLVKLHITGFWLLLVLVPFSRLVHIFSLPLQYLWRPPQVVVWTNDRRFAAAGGGRVEMEDRRAFLKAGVGLAAAGVLLAVGTADKLVRYLKGAELTPDEEAEILQKKAERLNQAAQQRTLELERVKSPFIQVATMAELLPKKGKYFIDYQMRPALAFKGDDGLPLLISAKCTHLGCTVGSEVDSQGCILCPCHISHFSLKTGMPNEGAPAKLPLPRIGWMLRDAQGNTLIAEGPSGKRTGSAANEALAGAMVYIAQHSSDGADA